MTYSIRSIEGLTPARLKILVVQYAADEELWRTQLRFDTDERFCLRLHSDELTCYKRERNGLRRTRTIATRHPEPV